MTRAIWYRHWLEIRLPVTIVGIAVAPLCLLLVMAALLGDLPPEVERPWVSGHISLSFLLVLVGSPALGATGVRTGMTGHPSLAFWAAGVWTGAPGPPSLYYTLTLPAARFTLIWTRFVVGAAATVALFTALLAAGTAPLLATGRSAPLGAMAATSVVAGLLAVALQAVNVLLSLWNERLDGTVFVAGFVVLVTAASYGWTSTTLAVMVMADEAAPWSVARIPVLIVAASLCLAAITARRHDF
ncbi:MAG: hypothetical protein OXG35_28285 [Acidobacteria bacterium]|nr:hypothetical protein [Acidobacteriota bacterium]